MAIVDAEPGEPAPNGWLARARALLGSADANTLTTRLAGTIFVIRVFSAGLAYFLQILLARGMAGNEYGTYAYVWTWVLLLGSILDCGLAVSAQKFIAEYRTRQQFDLLRGFLAGSRWLTFSVSSLIALILAGLVFAFSSHIDSATALPLYIGCLVLPGFVLGSVQDCIARAFDWMRLALMPQFVVRQGLIIVFAMLAFAAGANLSAKDAMAISMAAVWIAMIGQMLLLNHSLGGAVAAGPRVYDVRNWLATSLPILLVESFYMLLSYIDVLVLQYFRPADEVGIYYAVVKTLALIAFIHYAISASTAHRFSEYHTTGDHERLSDYLSHAIKWTFWPSLVATAALLAIGRPMLALFGPDFTSGYPLMFVLAIGLLARAAIGPIEKLLNMIGRQQLCAGIYAAAFVMNLVFCLVLVPAYGAYGAAASTTLSLVFESVVLFVVMRGLGYHVLAFGKKRAG